MREHEVGAASPSASPRPARSTSSLPSDAELFTSMLHNADIELVFKGGKRLLVHSAVLSITSALLAGLLSDLGEGLGITGAKMPNGSGPLQLHLLDDDPEGWRELLPLLYPRMNVPRLSWVEVRRVVGIAHKYDITLVLGACERFLNGDGDKVAPAELSAHHADPNYVLTWLEISERLHFDALYARCMSFIGSRYMPRSFAKCDYCGGAAPRSRRGGSGVVSSNPSGSGSPHHFPYTCHDDGCSCACASCGGFRTSCRCGPELPAAAETAPVPSAAGTSSAIGSAYAASASAARYTSYGTATGSPLPAGLPTGHGSGAGGGGAGSGGGGGQTGSRARGYAQPPGSYAEIYASAQRQLRDRYGAAERTAGEDFLLLYRRDAAGPPPQAGAGAAAPRQRHAEPAPPAAMAYAGHHAAAAAVQQQQQQQQPQPQQQRHASPYPTSCFSLVRSAAAAYGSGGSAAGRGPTGGGAAVYTAAGNERPPSPPRVLELVKGDRERLLALSGQTLVELLGMGSSASHA